MRIDQLPKADKVTGAMEIVIQNGTESLKTTLDDFLTAAADFGLAPFRNVLNSEYEGVDLTVKFADEIAKFTSPWEWIKSRIAAKNYKGLYICDFIPFTVGAETHEAQIMGINTYKRTTDRDIGDHIDFCSRDCYSETVKWNTTNNNNGTATVKNPYLASNVHDYLENTLYPLLPAELKSVIVNKRFLLEERYSASGALTDSTGWSWQDMGKLWIPTEYEVFGCVVWGTKGYSAMQSVQYPYFANSWKNRIKGAGPKGSRCPWWEASASSGNSAYACLVYYYGHANYGSASDAHRVPVCFRISA